MKHAILFGIAIFVFGVVEQAAAVDEAPHLPKNATPATVRKFTLDSIGSKQDMTNARKALLGMIRERTGAGKTMKASTIELLTVATDADAFLKLCLQPGGAPSAEVATWLLSEERLPILVDLITPHDQWPMVLKHITDLYQHDPDKRDHFFDLILAISVVWDSPRRPLHGQIGRGVLPFKPDLTKRYDYYKALYSTTKAKVSLRRLSARALVFVVDTPVPVSELEWVRDNVKGSLSSWGKQFFAIEYDHDRLKRGAYVWEDGVYTLESIRENGGICVDQAYYAAITARGVGIPAIMFTGRGRRGGHAWFSYMKSEREWELEVGRYAYDKYATGHAMDPQTNRQMSDHDVAFTCNRAFRSEKYDKAKAYGRLAKILAQTEPDLAAKLATGACKLVPLYAEGWDTLIQIYTEQDQLEKCAQVLRSKASAFRKFPDTVYKTRRAEITILTKLGRDAEAAQATRDLERKIDDRDDLVGNLSMSRVQELAETGKTAEARKLMEDYLKDNREEEEKLIPMMRQYLRITKNSGQTKEAVRFIKSFANKVPERSEKAFLAYLVTAYENDGDTRDAERLRKKLRDD
jgi:hypothetical protein